ncbi:polysaccharide biosynthesis/export family protein [Flavobacterium tegetincola]|uniref:polysaccharide biosynthesis/export family protein n=1 Tax=Flavobacterium tegetincola TaxID=150172 RepID=UPI00047B6004|nr:polysaccharide biosynthesis/export family protein [Flavobacterium tegetincola]
MRLERIGILCIIAVMLTSCVSRKQLIYLQDTSQGAEKMLKPVLTPEYRLQTNDIISLNIKAIDPALVAIFNPSNTLGASNGNQLRREQDTYYDGFTVDSHGNIRIPIIGEINIMGFTLDEVRLKIEKELLENYFNKEANIFVTVKMAGLRFTINGEIGAPGTKTMYQERVTVLEAIANAGDITIIGDRKNVTIIRQYPYGTEMHDIDLTDRKAMESPFYYLQPNDYIYVKPLAQKSWGTGTTGIQSLGTIVTLLSLATTTYLLLTR